MSGVSQRQKRLLVSCSIRAFFCRSLINTDEGRYVKASANITQPEGQLTLNFEPGLSDRYPSFRECVASSVYRYGLTNAAIDLDKAPGNLSVELSADPSRKFGIEDFEKYLAKSRDFTAIYYLIDKFLKEGAGNEPDAAELRAMFKQMAPTLKRMGML